MFRLVQYAVELYFINMDRIRYKLTFNENVLPSPYKDLTEDERTTISCRVPNEVHRLLSSIMPERGLWQRLFSSLIFAIHDELEQKGIKHWHPDYETELFNIIKRRCALTELNGRPDR